MIKIIKSLFIMFVCLFVNNIAISDSIDPDKNKLIKKDNQTYRVHNHYEPKDNTRNKLIFLTTWNAAEIKKASSGYTNENLEIEFKDINFDSLGAEFETARNSNNRYVVMGLTQHELNKYKNYILKLDLQERKLISKIFHANFTDSFLRLASPTICYNYNNLKYYIDEDAITVEDLLERKSVQKNSNLVFGDESVCNGVASGKYIVGYSTAYDSIKNSVSSTVNGITIGNADSPGWLYPIDLKSQGYVVNDKEVMDFTNWWVSEQMPDFVNNVVND